MNVQDAIFWWTGGVIWAHVAIALLIAVIIALLSAGVTAYHRAAQWMTVYLLLKWTKKSAKERKALNDELVDFVRDWRFHTRRLRNKNKRKNGETEGDYVIDALTAFSIFFLRREKDQNYWHLNKLGDQ